MGTSRIDENLWPKKAVEWQPTIEEEDPQRLVIETARKYIERRNLKDGEYSNKRLGEKDARDSHKLHKLAIHI